MLVAKTRTHLQISLWLALLLGLWVAVFADMRGWRRYLKLRAEVVELAAKNRVATRENQRLSREARALKDNPAAIERAVREELGFIHPGEMMLQLRPSPSSASP